MKKTNKKTFKLLNCHPKSTRKNKSCYNDDTIKLLKNNWNQKHNDKIISTKPIQIWKELKHKISECKNELCWLDKTLNDNSKIKTIKKTMFVPIAPLTSWKKNNNWLSSTEFNEVMEQYMDKYDNFLYLGPSSIDFDTIINGSCVWPELCNLSIKKEMDKGKDKIGIVLNLDTHKGGGTHWVSLFIDLKKKFIFFFESTGTIVPKEVKVFIERIKKQCEELGINMDIINNMKIRHQYGTSECGMYCLFFIISLLKEDKSPKYFLKNRIKDSDVEKYRSIYFNKLL
jgi:hypothetical protein